MDIKSLAKTVHDLSIKDKRELFKEMGKLDNYTIDQEMILLKQTMTAKFFDENGNPID